MYSTPNEAEARDDNWAPALPRLHSRDVPAGGYAINIDGRQVMSPLQGFGQLWRKVYRIRLEGCRAATPTEVMDAWKTHFPSFLPPTCAFYPSMAGVEPGEILYITAPLPIWPGSRGIIPLSTGVLILYSDEEMFTVMTPEGHPEAGWNTFSVFEADGALHAQVEGMVRANDPIYEFGFRYMGGARMSDKTWIHVLTRLGEEFGVTGQEVMVRKEVLDNSLQWRYATNLWRNAAIRTVFYVAGTPIRAAIKMIKPAHK